MSIPWTFSRRRIACSATSTSLFFGGMIATASQLSSASSLSYRHWVTSLHSSLSVWMPATSRSSSMRTYSSQTFSVKTVGIFSGGKPRKGSSETAGVKPLMIRMIMIFYCGLMVHITDTRAQKVFCCASPHITETVLAHGKAVYPLHSCIVIRKSTENG